MRKLRDVVYKKSYKIDFCFLSCGNEAEYAETMRRYNSRSATSYDVVQIDPWKLSSIDKLNMKIARMASFGHRLRGVATDSPFTGAVYSHSFAQRAWLAICLLMVTLGPLSGASIASSKMAEQYLWSSFS